MRLDWMLYGLTATAAVMALGLLMQQRQSTLKGLLRQHVDRQLQWRRTRNKTAQIAQRAVQNAVESEQTEFEAETTEATANEPAPPREATSAEAGGRSATGALATKANDRSTS